MVVSFERLLPSWCTDEFAIIYDVAEIRISTSISEAMVPSLYLPVSLWMDQWIDLVLKSYLALD